MKKYLLFFALIALFSSCDTVPNQQQSDSGVQKASIKVETDDKGTTAEQRNIMERLKRDNEVGSIKHLYIISSYTGDVMEYSTVVGKVTSGGKRLSPKTVIGDDNHSATARFNHVELNGRDYLTNEVLDDGGT